MDEKKYSQLYQALLQEVLQFHSGNQRRIRKGMLSLLLVPLVFLVLLFLSEGSRVIFLLLWIVSMFGIAAYLIAVEYIDYEMQNKVKQITKKEVELDQLTPLPSAMPQLLPLLRGRGQESEAAPEELAPEELAPEEPAPAEPCPAPVPPCPQPVPPRPASVPVQPEPLHPELALTLSDLQESSRQLAQGFEQMSRELGRISRSMGDQDRRSREVQS
ncbi:MAG TPA: hypothetical protein DGS89_07425 [Oscillibacter sp.]|jgi:hypothetical protein|nr:MAG: hypothetical protein DBX95_01180 [Oscillibacter sp.]HBL63379.1 hypothetical protein [Oscillibacter sp.]HCV07514.1 hypothetical protein [Oscillibacter sp.]